MRPRELIGTVNPRPFRRLILALIIASGFAVFGTPQALAHADLESVTPPDGTVSTVPIEQFELLFTAAVQPVQGGTRLLTGSSAVNVTILQPNLETVIVEPVQPLTDGRYALLWKVLSADGHVIEGTVSVEVMTETTTSTGASNGSGGGSESSATPPTTLASTTTTLPMVNTSLPPRAFETSQASVSSSDGDAGEWISSIGRWATMTGALIAIGAFLFAGTSLVGSLPEVRNAVRWVRRGGLLVLVGTLVEVIGAATAVAGSLSQALSPSTLVDVLATSFGVAVLLRIAGGIALLQDPRMAAASLVSGASAVPITAQSGTSHANGPGSAVTVDDRSADRYHLDIKQEWMEAAGIAAIALSFAFVGHSTTADPSVLARGSSIIHVLAAGIWFGGLIVMVDLLIRRRQAGSKLDAAATILRFSRSAVVAVVVVAGAGLALTWTIIDESSDLVSTAWGRLLLLKMALVAVAAIMGGYNHFRVVPLIENPREDSGAPARLRRIVTAEVLVLTGAVAITAVLVGLTI